MAWRASLCKGGGCCRGGLLTTVYSKSWKGEGIFWKFSKFITVNKLICLYAWDSLKLNNKHCLIILPSMCNCLGPMLTTGHLMPNMTDKVNVIAHLWPRKSKNETISFKTFIQTFIYLFVKRNCVVHEIALHVTWWCDIMWELIHHLSTCEYGRTNLKLETFALRQLWNSLPEFETHMWTHVDS